MILSVLSCTIHLPNPGGRVAQMLLRLLLFHLLDDAADHAWEGVLSLLKQSPGKILEVGGHVGLK